MASCDDDYSYIADDHFTNHHHIPPHHHENRHSQPKPSPATAENDAVKPSEASTSENGAVLQKIIPYGAGEFDPKNSRVSESSEKREREQERERDRDDDVSDGSFKKARHVSSGGGGSGGGEYRKDREEWSDAAIECLLDAYTEKFTQLNRGNLRGRDWEEVAVTVSGKCENQSKSVEQCKNKVDNLKKRYKLEKHRMTSAGVEITHWPWFKKMDFIVVNSMAAKALSDDDKVGGGGGGGSCGSLGRQSTKRYAIGTPISLGQVNNSKSAPKTKWKRVVFKISGAALAGSGPHNVDPKVILLIASEVATAYRIGIQVAIVIGGRNFFCGDTWLAATGVDRSTTYQIGMMATVMNSVLLQSALEKMDVQTRVQTTFALPGVGEPYNRQKAVRHLEKGRVVIFGGGCGGSGNPLFSTDSAAALRATELNAQALLKGINVDAIYDCNIRNDGNTFDHFSFREVASKGPTSIDVMALTFCEENTIPVVLFNLLEPGNISKALRGEQIGTLIDQAGSVS